MVVVLDHDVKFPETDKSTVKRWQFYKEFEPVIQATYAQLDGIHGHAGTLVLNLPARF